MLQNFQEPIDALKIDARLGNAISLTHYSTSPSFADLQPGMTFTLMLYWQATAIPEDDYTVFVKVRDTNGNIIAELDAPRLMDNTPPAIGQLASVLPLLTR